MSQVINGNPGYNFKSMDKVDLSNTCRELYMKRLQSKDLFQQKSKMEPKLKSSMDQAMEKLRNEVSSMMDQEMSLMKQLLTLNEAVEDLKWRHRLDVRYDSISCTSFSSYTLDSQDDVTCDVTSEYCTTENSYASFDCSFDSLSYDSDTLSDFESEMKLPFKYRGMSVLSLNDESSGAMNAISIPHPSCCPGQQSDSNEGRNEISGKSPRKLKRACVYNQKPYKLEKTFCNHYDSGYSETENAEV